MLRNALVALAFVAGCSDSSSESPPEDAVADSVIDDTAMITETAVGDTSPEDTAPSDTAPGDSTTADTSSSDSAVSDGGDTGGCSAPALGTLHVAPTGDDTTGTGSTACPFKTISAAILAADAATVATTITLENGTYGSACTGGAPCDALPIAIPASITKGLIVRGTGAASAVRIVGGTEATDSKVLYVLAPNVGFENLTVAPRRLMGAFEGGWGIEFHAAASATEASVKNVVIEGVTTSATSQATGTGIQIWGGTSPTLGPGLVIKGGSIGIQVWPAPTGASKPIVTSSAAQPTSISDSTTACIALSSPSATLAVPNLTLTSTSTADPGRLHLQNCGSAAIQLQTGAAGAPTSIARTLIDGATTQYGILAQGAAVFSTGEAVAITGLGTLAEYAIGVAGTASFTATAGLVVSNNKTMGVRVSATAKANLDGVVVSDNGNAVTQPGFYCADSAQVKIRNSTFLGNSGNGVWAEGNCALDLGSTGSLGNNVFQRTSHKNARVGLCYLSSVSATATSSAWSCGLAATAACTPATATTPKPVSPFSCLDAGTFDWFSPMSTLTVPPTPQTCCGL